MFRNAVYLWSWRSMAFACTTMLMISCNAGTTDPFASDAISAGSRWAGLYVGQADCTWTETTRGGDSTNGAFVLPLELLVTDEGDVLMDGEPLESGSLQSVSFGDVTQTVHVTNVSSTSAGLTWTADFDSTSTEGDFSAAVRGAIRFEGDNAVFQRSLIGVFQGESGTTVDRVEQCRGHLAS